MLEKTGILFVILALLLIFYLVIRLGAGKKKGHFQISSNVQLFERRSYFDNYTIHSSSDFMVFFIN